MKNNALGVVPGSFREGGKTLSTLVRMQLREKMDLGFMRSPRGLIFKLVWMLIEFAAITTLITVAFFFVKLLGFFSLVHDIPVSVISLLFSVMLLLSLISNVIRLTRALYFSRDNTLLLTFPATPSLVFFSKLMTFYVYELRNSFLFTIPMFIAYGIVKGYALVYYPWLLLMFLLISVIPVLLAALLSIPAMFGYVFLSQTKVLQYILYAAIGGGTILALWKLIGLIPENINFIETWGHTFWQIQDFLSDYTENFAPLYGFTELIVGKTVGLRNVLFHSDTFGSLLILVGIVVVLLGMCFLCSKPLFCRMASTPFEFKKNNAIQARKNKKWPPFLSAIHKEWIIGLRSNSFVKLFEILVVVMPVSIYLLNKLYSAMNTRYLGTQMTICFNILIILLILLMTNIDMASVYSRDGSSAYLNKVQPAPYAKLLYAKLFFPMIIALIGTVFTVMVFTTESALSTKDGVLIGTMIYGIYVAHLFSSAESDIMNPQHKQYATFSEQANNPNESRSGVMALIFAMLIFLVALFLSSRNEPGTWLKLAIFAIAFAAFKILTFVMKIKAFYKETQA